MRKRYSNRLRFRRAAALFLKRAVFIAAVFLAVYFIPKAAGGVLSGGDYVHFSDSLGTFLLKTGLNRSYELPGFSPLSFFFPNIKPAPVRLRITCAGQPAAPVARRLIRGRGPRKAGARRRRQHNPHDHNRRGQLAISPFRRYIFQQ